MMTTMTRFAMLPYDEQLRAKLNASEKYDVRNFYTLTPQVRQAVYEAAVELHARKAAGDDP
jgi:hypothetical protein